MPRAYHTLGDLQGRLTLLEVRCSRCDRRGRLRLARLIAEHGADAALPHLRHTLVGDCPRREVRDYENRGPWPRMSPAGAVRHDDDAADGSRGDGR